MRDADGRRPHGGRHDPLPARRGRPEARRRRRDGDRSPEPGLLAVRPLAPRPSRRLGRLALGRLGGEKAERGQPPREEGRGSALDTAIQEFLIAENRITVTAWAPLTSRLYSWLRN